MEWFLNIALHGIAKRNVLELYRILFIVFWFNIGNMSCYIFRFRVAVTYITYFLIVIYRWKNGPNGYNLVQRVKNISREESQQRTFILFYFSYLVYFTVFQVSLPTLLSGSILVVHAILVVLDEYRDNKLNEKTING